MVNIMSMKKESTRELGRNKTLFEKQKIGK